MPTLDSKVPEESSITLQHTTHSSNSPLTRPYLSCQKNGQSKQLCSRRDLSNGDHSPLATLTEALFRRSHQQADLPGSCLQGLERLKSSGSPGTARGTVALRLRRSSNSDPLPVSPSWCRGLSSRRSHPRLGLLRLLVRRTEGGSSRALPDQSASSATQWGRTRSLRRILLGACTSRSALLIGTEMLEC